jgi:N-methylhydantoinase A/oxoprolinase/acetone carboxylase beta subunit
MRVRKAQVRSQVLHVIGSCRFDLLAAHVDFFWLFRKEGPLAVTDANLLLGRLIPNYFPKIFGKSEKEPLDTQASKTAFEKLAKEINETNKTKLTLDEIVYG